MENLNLQERVLAERLIFIGHATQAIGAFLLTFGLLVRSSHRLPNAPILRVFGEPDEREDF